MKENNKNSKEKGKNKNEGKGKREKQNKIKKNRKELSFNEKVLILIGVIALALLIYTLYTNYENKAVLRECKEIEKGILENPELGGKDVFCKCYPGKTYKGIINATPELKEKANLRYVLVCSTNNGTKIYPVWVAKGEGIRKN